MQIHATKGLQTNTPLMHNTPADKLGLLFSQLTPSYNKATDEQLFSRGESDDDDGVQVKAFTEHPEKVARHEVLCNDMDGLTPPLKTK